MKALCFDNFGDPEVLEYRTIPDPEVGEGEISVKMQAIGLNFGDVYRRRGNYHLEGEPPYILGYEGAGIVEEISSDVKEFRPDDRIAFADVPYANAELVVVPIEKAIPIPEDITFEIAASVLLQGLTAQYLTHDSYRLQASDTVLIHAVAGGVGQLLTQIVKMLGGYVIGLTSSERKRDFALQNGADKVFLYSQDWRDEVLTCTKNRGVDVVYESVGSTLMQSFEVTKIGGTVVFYGMAGADPEFVDPRMLLDTSKTLTGGDLWNVLVDHQERIKRANMLFDWIQKGKIEVKSLKSFKLSEGAEAHQFLESRQSIGKIILIP